MRREKNLVKIMIATEEEKEREGKNRG